MAQTPSQWKPETEATSSWAANNPPQSSWEVTQPTSSNWSRNDGSTRQVIYSDPIATYDDPFPYNGWTIAVTSNFETTNPITSNWSEV